MPTIRIQTEAFDSGAEMAAISRNRTDIGAVASFVGLARDMNHGDDVRAMVLEHYPGMTEKVLAGLVDEARSRWALLDVTLIHRVGACCRATPSCWWRWPALTVAKLSPPANSSWII